MSVECGDEVFGLGRGDRLDQLMVVVEDALRCARPAVHAGSGHPPVPLTETGVEAGEEPVAAGRNRLLTGFYTSLGERHRRMTTTSVHRRTGTSQRILDDHHELIEAIAAAEPEHFIAALDRHLLAVHGVATGTGTRSGEPR